MDENGSSSEDDFISDSIVNLGKRKAKAIRKVLDAAGEVEKNKNRP